MKRELLLFILLLPVVASANDIQPNSIFYQFDKTTKEATVIRDPYSSCSGTIVLPDEVVYEDVTYKVTRLGNSVFANMPVTSVVIPNTVKSIGDYVFEGCTDLTSVIIPTSVTSIGARAFSGCVKLENIELPNTITSIEDYTFFGCTDLNSIEIPNMVTSIGNYAFLNCI